MEDKKKSFTIGITGGSGSGKTAFLERLSRHFAPDEICLISQDNYYKPREQQAIDEKGIKNFDLPSSIDHERFLRDIKALKAGQPVRLTEYTFNNPAADPKILEFKPTPVLIVEGLFISYFKSIAVEFDIRLFIEAKDHLMLSRRIKRDQKERGYDLDDVLYRYQYHVMPVYDRMIRHLREESDLVIPNNIDFGMAIEVFVPFIKSKITGIAY